MILMPLSPLTAVRLSWGEYAAAKMRSEKNLLENSSSPTSYLSESTSSEQRQVCERSTIDDKREGVW